MNVSNLLLVAKNVSDFIRQNQLQVYVSTILNQANQINPNVANLTPQQQNQQAQQQRSFFVDLSASLQTYIKILKNFDISNWTSEQFDIFKKTAISAIFDIEKLENAYGNAVKSAPAVRQEISDYTNSFNQVLGQLNQLISVLTSINIDIDEFAITPEMGVIEIAFAQDVDITDFTKAREQMSDWFLIFDGYARFLDVHNEDFEIFSITKQSPTKIKVKTLLDYALAILLITNSLLEIQKHILEKELIIEHLKKNELVSEADQKKFIDSAEENIKSEINKSLDSLVDRKLIEHGINVSGDSKGNIRNSLKKSLEKQYQFTIKGGDVRIQIGDGNHQDEVLNLEKTKQGIMNTKDTLIQIRNSSLKEIRKDNETLSNN